MNWRLFFAQLGAKLVFRLFDWALGKLPDDVIEEEARRKKRDDRNPPDRSEASR